MQWGKHVHGKDIFGFIIGDTGACLAAAANENTDGYSSDSTRVNFMKWKSVLLQEKDFTYLDTHRFGGFHDYDSGITTLNELGGFLELFAGSPVDFLLDFGKLACNVASVTIQDWGISVLDLAMVVENDDLKRRIKSRSVEKSN